MQAGSRLTPLQTAYKKLEIMIQLDVIIHILDMVLMDQILDYHHILYLAMIKIRKLRVSHYMNRGMHLLLQPYLLQEFIIQQALHGKKVYGSAIVEQIMPQMLI